VAVLLSRYTLSLPHSVQSHPDEAAPKSWIGRISWIFSLVLAASLLYFSLRGVDWGGVWRIIAAARWQFLLLFAALNISTYFMRAFRWRILLNAAGHFRFETVFWANMAGYLANNLLPARGGELVRTVLISARSSLSRTFVLTTALSERVMDTVAVLLWTPLAMIGMESKPRWMEEAARGLLVVAVAVVTVTALLPRFAPQLEWLLKRLPLPAAARAFLLRTVEQVLAGLRALHDGRRLGAFAAMTVVAWSFDAFAVMACGRGLGFTISFRVAVLLLTGLALGSTLPSTPGYVGIFQFVAVTILPPFGVSRDGALAYILVAQVFGYAVTAAFGLPGLYRLKQMRKEASC
jgi:glycosyltransferase 2 family protein